jgi:uncharacterized protein (DUF1501 family)
MAFDRAWRKFQHGDATKSYALVQTDFGGGMSRLLAPKLSSASYGSLPAFAICMTHRICIGACASFPRRLLAPAWSWPADQTSAPEREATMLQSAAAAECAKEMDA